MKQPDGGTAAARALDRKREHPDPEQEASLPPESNPPRKEQDKLRHDTPTQPLEGDAWERVLLARHAQRPYSLDLIHMLFTDFTELHGDRRFGDDQAMVCGLARFEGKPVMVVGQQKGRDTKQKVARNFGMPNPEGYRKALRLMQMAARFAIPIITLVDTPGASPGIGAEERGQAEAIATNLKEIPKLRVPIVVVIHGEGGSGGALAIAIGDQVIMLENAIYSVIAPESCSSILWRDWDHKEEAARILKLTAGNLRQFGIVDIVSPEPAGGAHTDPEQTAATLRSILAASLLELSALPVDRLISRRYQRLRQLATYVTGA
ncbi:MAG TPA: acetyl-CoA carboxylase carboxyltransferase subunit alpha [Terriglobia bacterium]|nr:acetyl-CoA carboxylase carboxyltransferase subunit alpha [Terriglobia bacterium]